MGPFYLMSTPTIPVAMRSAMLPVMYGLLPFFELLLVEDLLHFLLAGDHMVQAFTFPGESFVGTEDLGRFFISFLFPGLLFFLAKAGVFQMKFLHFLLLGLGEVKREGHAFSLEGGDLFRGQRVF